MDDGRDGVPQLARNHPKGPITGGYSLCLIQWGCRLGPPKEILARLKQDKETLFLFSRECIWPLPVDSSGE